MRNRMSMQKFRGALGLVFAFCASMAAYAQEPILQITDLGSWRLVGLQWKPYATSTKRDPITEQINVPSSADGDIERCMLVKYCEIKAGDLNLLVELINIKVNSEVETKAHFKAINISDVTLVSRIGGENEVDLLINRGTHGSALGRLGPRVAIDLARRTIYTFRCVSAYRCQLIERTFDGEETVGPVLDVKVSDLLSYNNNLWMLYAKSSAQKSGGGVLGKFGHGRFKEDWWVAEVKALSQIDGASVLARDQTNAAGYFLNKADIR